MCRKGSAATAAEVRNALRSGWQPAAPALTLDSGFYVHPKAHLYMDRAAVRPSSSDLCPSGLPRNLEFIKNWVSQAVCQYAAVISAGLLESSGVRGVGGVGGQDSIAYSNLEPLILFC